MSNIYHDLRADISIIQNINILPWKAGIIK